MKMLGVTIACLVFGTAACGGNDHPTAASVPAATGSPSTEVPTAEPGQVEILAVHEGFEFYNPCGDAPLEVFGATYYPVYREDVNEIDEARYPIEATPEGLVRVAPPGPGDDVGTMVLYADGMARFESDSGMVTWFTDQELTYDWVC